MTQHISNVHGVHYLYDKPSIAYIAIHWHLVSLKRYIKLVNAPEKPTVANAPENSYNRDSHHIRAKSPNVDLQSFWICDNGFWQNAVATDMPYYSSASYSGDRQYHV